MNGKEQLIEILTQRYKRYDGVFRKNAFDSEPRYQYYSFNEISTLDDANIDRIIQAYQSKTSEPMSINNRLLLLDCVYETIADNKRYQELFDKLIDIYKIELDDKLTKSTTRYDDFNFVETSELHQAPYTTFPEYSLVLADMCTRYINESQKSYTDNSILPSNKVESRISTYEAIKSDFAKVNQQMPEVQEKQSAKIIPPVQPVVEHSQQQVSQEESEKILQDQQKQMKDQVINQIMGAMNKSGELSFGDISMGERMSIMQNIQNKLNAKSMDELQMLLSTYQEQNIQEESMHSGMHR